MTVDFPISYPANTASANKPIDIQTLQEAFAMALRNYGTDAGNTADNTMLEIIRSVSHSDNATGDDRNQQRREQQHTDRNGFASIDRSQLDKSEMRSSEMHSDYQNRQDRHEILRRDYQEKIEHNERPPTTSPDIPAPATWTPPSVDVARPNETTPPRDHSSPQNVPATSGMNNPSSSINIISGAPVIGQANVMMPGGNIPVSMPAPVTPQVITPQAFTLFTPSGRLGQPSKKMDEKENEEEESVEEKEGTKPQPFAVFEAIHAASIRATRKNASPKPKESMNKSELQQITEKPREKPKEAEPNQVRSVETMKELLNTSAQSIVVPKKGEQNQPNQTQYLNRIAAACEAASHYAPIRIKLNLDHLGTLTLRFFHKADKLTLRFETPSKESVQFIKENLDGLRTILSKRNVEIANIEILSKNSKS